MRRTLSVVIGCLLLMTIGSAIEDTTISNDLAGSVGDIENIDVFSDPPELDFADGSDTYYVGQTLRADGFEPEDDVVLETGDGQFISDVAVSTNGTVLLDTSSRGAGEYVLKDGDGTEYTFDLLMQNLKTTSPADTTISVYSNRGDYTMSVSSDSLDTAEIAAAIDGAVEQDGMVTYDVTSTSASISIDQSELPTGDHTLWFNVVDTTASDSVTVNGQTNTGTGPGSGSVSFGRHVIMEEQGDTVAIPLLLQGTTTAELQFGSHSVNYLVTVDVKDEDGDGTVTVQLDTHSAGYTGEERDSWSAKGKDRVTQVKRKTGQLESRLADETYAMSLSVDGAENDVGTVSLRLDSDGGENSEEEKSQPATAPEDGVAPVPTVVTFSPASDLADAVKAASSSGETVDTEDMASRIASDTGLSASEARTAMDSFARNAEDALEDGDAVRFAGFGTFSTSSREGWIPGEGATDRNRSSKEDLPREQKDTGHEKSNGLGDVVSTITEKLKGIFG